MKHIYDNNFATTLEKIKPLVQEVDTLPDGSDFMEVLFRYLYGKSRVKNQEILEDFAVESLKEESEVRVKTVVEMIREEERLKFAEASRKHAEERRKHAEERRRFNETLVRQDEMNKAHQKSSALAMLELGLPVEKAAEITGLDPKVVALLAKQQHR